MTSVRVRRLVWGGLSVLGVALLCGAACVFRDRWLPTAPAETAEEAHDDHHGGGGDSIVLSEQARKNLGLEFGSVKVGPVWRTVSVPAIITERPGHSHRKVTAPLTGIVRELFVHPNQLVRPGDPLAELELTGDSLAVTQSELLAVVRDLDINARETERIAELVASGSVPSKNRLQLDYDRSRLESQKAAKIQALQVLGLDDKQIAAIARDGKLLRTFQMRVPGFSSEERTHVGDARTMPAEPPRNAPQNPVKPAPETPAPAGTEPEWSYTVESIDVYPGKRVTIGDELCSLAFHVVLFIEGQAPEGDEDLVSEALIRKRPLAARFERSDGPPLIREGLRILFADNVVDADSRTFRFYVPLANEVLFDGRGTQGETYRSWKFKPGRRLTLDLPTTLIEEGIVVPEQAIVREGSEVYVFRANGKELARQAVQLLRSQGDEAVLAHDGSLIPGEKIAFNRAYLINLELKRQAGGGGHDPHAGHNH